MIRYDKLFHCLLYPQVGIMGLYGMGGVGKTTLLKKINNDFLTTSNDFDVVIWVVVSKPSNIEKMQEEEKAAEILRVLKTKKFVLLLDDIWERLDLLEMGVPHPDAQNKSKIVFTTRSLDVCHQMKAQKSTKVECLPSEEAWTLFQKAVGEETLKSHPHIPNLAKVVAKECKGLPLALVTVGRAMVGEKDPSIWDKVIQDLSKFPAEISGMEDELFNRLKVSYDRLSDNAIKSCFIYCSLFSKDLAIHIETLIEYSIGEGLLGEVHDIYEARNQGHKIVKKLKHACLLESYDLREKRVGMHDVIRDMALWLYGECGKENNKILVYDDVFRLKEAAEISELKETERMSLWYQNLEKFPETLIGFFQFMPRIRVLNLSGNENLSELPTEIGELNGLRYLNLLATRIGELPIELKNLKNLMILLLDFMHFPVTIPQDLISNLVSLKLFSLWNTNILSGVETLLEELESLNDINEIQITISSALSLNKLKRSHKLQRCISYLLLLLKWGDVITLELSSSFLKRMEHLQDFVVDHCDDVIISMEREGTQNDVTGLSNYNVASEQYFYSLRYIGIRNCSKLLDLTWVVYASCLEVLYVEDCESIELVLHHDHGAYEIVENFDIFSRLKCLKLNRLPRLKSIYQHPLLFPSLEIIKVYGCKSLRSLPFDSNTSNNNLKKIKGGTNWWNQLKWKDETIKDRFTPYFQVHEAEAYFTEESKASSIDDMQEQLVSN
ncbi:hypothetical protein PVL29_011498 [Vitis rotundifolia]|uniref:NB-ARC domain-containing protein n=1 Tax=Vitis rotundifolia TaxID=103349 RepID=A0AA38ZP78_VITRO|nr:hypothetical protein PVL29_011498 [Vitis rotundifolia]